MIVFVVFGLNICSQTCLITCLSLLTSKHWRQTIAPSVCSLTVIWGDIVGCLGVSPLVFTDVLHRIHPCCAVSFVSIPSMQQKGRGGCDNKHTNKLWGCVIMLTGVRLKISLFSVELMHKIKLYFSALYLLLKNWLHAAPWGTSWRENHPDMSAPVRR